MFMLHLIQGLNKLNSKDLESRLKKSGGTRMKVKLSIILLIILVQGIFCQGRMLEIE